MDYQNKFWCFEGLNDLAKTAIILECGQSITYDELNCRVEEKVLELSNGRELALLKASNSLNSIIDYLACLRSRSPFILVDHNLSDSLLESLVSSYSPNFILDQGNIERISKHTHHFHEDLAMLLSTSGSTGSPKLVKLTYDNIQSNTESISKYLGVISTDCACITLPLSYSYGLSILNTHIFSGGSLFITSKTLLNADFWRGIKTHQVTSLSGVPFTFQMLKKLRYERFDTSSIRYLTQAGGKLDRDTIEYFVKQCRMLGQDFFVMYGQTEASPRISYVPPNALEKKPESIGIAIPGGELFLVDEDNNEIKETNIQGEICYRGDNVMMGYATSPCDFALCSTLNRVLYTGDLGYFDTDGYYYIDGRKSRFIKLFGSRISLDDVDNWLVKNNISGVATGTDESLKLILEGLSDIEAKLITTDLSKIFKIQQKIIIYHLVNEIPRINGGKIDFKTLNDFYCN